MNPFTSVVAIWTPNPDSSLTVWGPHTLGGPITTCSAGDTWTGGQSTMKYRIARNFRGIKFSRKASHETFHDFIFKDEACTRDSACSITEIKNFVRLKFSWCLANPQK